MSRGLGTWVDGHESTSVPADDRGLHYGDGLFETLLIRGGRARFVEQHLARLQAGCLRLGIALPAPAVAADIQRACQRSGAEAVLKILVTRGSARRRGYAPQGDEVARRVVSLWEAPPLPEDLREGVPVILATGTVADHPGLAGIKHLSRLENVLAAREAQSAGAFDALLRGADGRIVCGGFTNVFVIRGREILTPAVDLAGVAGVMRGVVLREASVLGLQARAGRVSLEDVLSADGVFLTNARLGVVPVRRVGEHACRRSDLTAAVSRHLEALDA